MNKELPPLTYLVYKADLNKTFAFSGPITAPVAKVDRLIDFHQQHYSHPDPDQKSQPDMTPYLHERRN